MITPATPQKGSVYAFSNACEVVEAFLQKYARAAYIFAKINRIGYFVLINHLINYYRYNQRKWYAVKKAIKEIDKNEDYFQNGDICREYLTFVKQNYPHIKAKVDKDSEFGQILSLLDRIFGIDFITQE